MNRLLLFDFDGVLVESQDVYYRVVRWCLERIGAPIVKDREDFLALFDDNFYRSLTSHRVDLDAFFTALKEYASRVDYYTDVQPVADIYPVLKELVRTTTLVVVSSNSAQAIARIFSRHAYNGCFQAVLGSEAAFSKLEKIARARRHFGASLDETYYIGDTVGDIREGKEAGVRTVAVTWGWHDRRRLAAALPDFLVDTPQELLNLFGAG